MPDIVHFEPVRLQHGPGFRDCLVTGAEGFLLRNRGQGLRDNHSRDGLPRDHAYTATNTIPDTASHPSSYTASDPCHPSSYTASNSSKHAGWIGGSFQLRSGSHGFVGRSKEAVVL